MLAFAPPVLALIFEPDGLRHEWFHQARSLLAIWIYVLAVGMAIQVTTDALSFRWPGLLHGRCGVFVHLALVCILVSAITVALARPLCFVCPGLRETTQLLWIRGLILSCVYVLLGRIYQSMRRVHDEILLARARSELELAEARYATLIARTRPHFLHNALAAVAGMLPRNAAMAEQGLRDLSALFREVVEGTVKDTVSVSEELATIQRYLRVQEMRFAPKLSFSITVDPLVEDERIPPLVLLPLVENAVLHGLSDGEATQVQIRVALARDHVRLIVTDDGPGHGRSRHREGTRTSIEDLNRRLFVRYATSAYLRIEAANAGASRPGTRVEIGIPREDD